MPDAFPILLYLKYWNIDELYAALETKNIIYLAVNSIAWVIAVSFYQYHY